MTTNRRFLLSRMFEWVNYDTDKRILTLKFRIGGTYAYSAVPEKIYNELVSAISKGRYYNTKIKNRYVSRRLN